MAPTRAIASLRALFLLPLMALTAGSSGGYALSDEENEPPALPISRQGSQLAEDGDAWRAVGFHCPDAAFGPGSACARTASLPDFRRKQRRVVERALAMGATVLRVGAYQSALVEGPNPYRHLDRLVTYARGAGLRLLLVIESHDPVCRRVDREKTVAWYHSGWRDPYGAYRMSLTDHAEKLAQRYAYEPTVMGFEIVEGATPDTLGVVLAHLHGEVARVLRVRSPHALIVSGARLNCNRGLRGYEDWIAANQVGLLDAVSAVDLDEPHAELPACLQAAKVGADRLNRPLFVGAAGIRRDAFAPRERAQKMVDKAATAADLGVSLYTVSSLGSDVPEVEAFDIEPREPLARSLPHLAASHFAQVAGCEDADRCPVNFWALPDPLPPAAVRVEAMAGY